jgi:uncharacterized protein (TIGR03435 family)
MMDDSQLEASCRHNLAGGEFASLVKRHIDFVHAAALRQTGDPEVAQDITQAVFLIFSQRAGRLKPGTLVKGWLFNTTRYVVANARRAEARRKLHEREAAEMRSETVREDHLAWVTPYLDDALADLPERDRRVLFLRFFEDLPIAALGKALGISEYAAQKRVGRALDRLRLLLAKRDASIPIASVGEMLSASAAHVAPGHVVKSTLDLVTSGASGAAGSSSAISLAKGSAYLMAATKVKIAIAFVVIGLLTIPTTVVVIHYAPSLLGDSADAKPPAAVAGMPAEMHEPWQVEKISSDAVSRLPPEVKILPTRFPHSSSTELAGAAPGSGKFVGIRVSVKDIVTVAFNWPSARVIFVNGEPEEKYDFVSTLLGGSLEALQVELKDKLGLVAHRETRNVDVLLLTVNNTNAPSLKPAKEGDNFYLLENDNDLRIYWDDAPLSRAPELLEGVCNMPVLDETGLKQHFSIDLRWKELGGRDPKHDALKAALLKQLGLELVPSHASVEMLIVEQVRK